MATYIDGRRVPDDLVPPSAGERAVRVRQLVAVADALVAGRKVPLAAGRMLGKAINEWLRDGGDLEARLRVRPPAGSRHTAAYFARRFSQTLQDQGFIEGSSRGARRQKNSRPISPSRHEFAKVD